MNQHITEHPQWAHRNVTLICGPPASGKTTLAHELHPTVIELEQFTAPTPRERLKLFGRAAYRTGRNPAANTAIIRGAPTQAERAHHEQLCKPARTIVLLTPAATCHQRIDQRARQRAQGEHQAVDQWWQAWHNEHTVITSRQW